MHEKMTWQKVKTWKGWQTLKRFVVSIITLAISVGLAVLIWFVWNEYQNSTGDRRVEYLKIFIQLLGGGIIIYGLYLTFRRTKAIEDTSRSQFEALKITEEGQITERFTKAVEQLGNKDRLEIRLGGIYALERIARDSKEDHWTVMEVLTAFVRENSPFVRGNSTVEKTERKIRTDIQAIFTVIGRRKWVENEPGRIDLEYSYLRGANCVGANLEGAILWGANLEGVNLTGANFRGADLTGATLGGANLEGANFRGVDLRRANLHNTDLRRADLREADLTEAFLGQVLLDEADLTGADLGEALLEVGDLWGANLEGTNLRGANLEGTNLRGANLGGANLMEVRNLSLKQLSEVYTLYWAKLDSSLLEQVKKKYPHLLEKPKEEK